MRDDFFPRLWRGTLPLIVWGLHFAFCYLYAAAACSPGGSGTPSRLLLGGVSLAALAACGLLVWRARATLREAGEATGLLAWAAAGGAVLALAGVAWTTLPLLMLGGCA